MTEGDLAAHTSTWEQPISVTYRGFRVYECPPNGQGITALIALNLLEGFDLAARECSLPRRSTCKSKRCVWHSPTPAGTSLTRPSARCRLSSCVSKEYAAARRKLISPERGDAASPTRRAGELV